jgi:hypothetical protein
MQHKNTPTATPAQGGAQVVTMRAAPVTGMKDVTRERAGMAT